MFKKKTFSKSYGYVTPFITIFMLLIAVSAMIYFAFMQNSVAKDLAQDSLISHEIYKLEEKKAAINNYALFAGYQAAFDAAIKGESDEELEKYVKEKIKNNVDYSSLGVEKEGELRVRIEEQDDGTFFVKSTGDSTLILKSKNDKIGFDEKSKVVIEKHVPPRFFLLYDLAQDFRKGRKYRSDMMSILKDCVKNKIESWGVENIKITTKDDGLELSGEISKSTTYNVKKIRNAETIKKEIFEQCFIDLENEIRRGSKSFSEIVSKDVGIAIDVMTISISVDKDCELDSDCYDECYDDCGDDKCWYSCNCRTICNENGKNCHRVCDTCCDHDCADDECKKKCNRAVWSWDVNFKLNVSLIDHSDVEESGSDGKFKINARDRILLETGDLVPLIYRVDRMLDKSSEGLSIHYNIKKIKYTEDYSYEHQKGKNPDNNPNYWTRSLPDYEINWIVFPTE